MPDLVIYALAIFGGIIVPVIYIGHEYTDFLELRL